MNQDHGNHATNSDVPPSLSCDPLLTPLTGRKGGSGDSSTHVGPFNENSKDIDCLGILGKVKR